jgi:type 2 lantibiotic biosynthesis protein LanM
MSTSLAPLSAQARYLHERLVELSAGASAVPEPGDDFRNWKQVFTAGTYDRFSDRLRSLGISEEQAVYLTVEPPTAAAQPDPWEEVLNQALQYPAVGLEGSQAFPFSVLWLPLVAFARQNLFPSSGMVAVSAIDSLLLSLLQEISEAASFPAFEQFSQHRQNGGSFETFIQSVRQNDYRILFERFPVLARQISHLLTSWISSTSIFLERLRTDFSEVVALTQSENLSPKLVRTETGISDRHDGGKQVILLIFDDGKQVLYKPKDLSIAEALSQVDRWLAGAGFTAAWRLARFIKREGYGWEEFVEQRPCQSEQEVRHYYQGGGELLCLAYLLNGCDLGFENVMAAGDRPVPIDTESFFHPGRGSAKFDSTPSTAHILELGTPSVIETGLLPFWQLSASHVPADYCGLGSGLVDLSHTNVMEWENLNSNGMHSITKSRSPRQAGNTVRLGSEVQDVRRYQAELIAGFGRLYHFVLDRRTEFRQLIDQFGESKTRFVYRPTTLYGLLLKQARTPKCLTSGVRHSTVYEQLYRVPLRDNALTPEIKKLIDFEVQSLLGLDIPRFHIRLNSTDLLGQDFSLSDAARKKPIEVVFERIAAMGADDFRFQTEVIEESLRRFPATTKKPLTGPQAELIVRQFATELTQRINKSESPNLWDPPTYLPRDLSAAHCEGIYLGDMGPLIFLAAADRLTGPAFPKRQASRFRERLARFEPPDDYPLGICNGVGALIYGALVLAKLTGEGNWTTLALSLNKRVRFRPDKDEPDIISGVAGLLVALTRLYQITSDADAAANALTAAQMLAARYHPELGWPRSDGDSYVGFAHGLAGIGFALTQYGRAFSDPQFNEIVEHAFKLETSFFDARNSSWPIAVRGPQGSLNNWCNGTAGILLAMTDVATPQKLSGDQLDVIVEKIRHRGSMDHWCCGNFGIAEVLSYIATKEDRTEIQAKSAGLVEQSLERGLQGAFFRLQQSVGENFCFSPSLFRGTSGIGYSLLRFAYPGELPCILAFEV